MLKNIMKRNEGFTLVELLVVIVVIGILAAIAIPVFLSQADKANMASAQSDVTNLAKLVQADLADNQDADLSGQLVSGVYTSIGGFGSVALAGDPVTIDTEGAGLDGVWCVDSIVDDQKAAYDSAQGLVTGSICSEL